MAAPARITSRAGVRSCRHELVTFLLDNCITRCYTVGMGTSRSSRAPNRTSGDRADELVATAFRTLRRGIDRHGLRRLGRLLGDAYGTNAWAMRIHRMARSSHALAIARFRDVNEVLCLIAALDSA